MRSLGRPQGAPQAWIQNDVLPVDTESGFAQAIQTVSHSRAKMRASTTTCRRSLISMATSQEPPSLQERGAGRGSRRRWTGAGPSSQPPIAVRGRARQNVEDVEGHIGALRPTRRSPRAPLLLRLATPDDLRHRASVNDRRLLRWYAELVVGVGANVELARMSSSCDRSSTSRSVRAVAREVVPGRAPSTWS